MAAEATLTSICTVLLLLASLIPWRFPFILYELHKMFSAGRVTLKEFQLEVGSLLQNGDRCDHQESSGITMTSTRDDICPSLASEAFGRVDVFGILFDCKVTTWHKGRSF